MRTLFIILFVASSLFAQQMSKEEFKEKLKDRLKTNRADFERCMVLYTQDVAVEATEKKLNSDQIFDAAMSLIKEYEEYCRYHDEVYSYSRFKEFVNNAR